MQSFITQTASGSYTCTYSGERLNSRIRPSLERFRFQTSSMPWVYHDCGVLGICVWGSFSIDHTDTWLSTRGFNTWLETELSQKDILQLTALPCVVEFKN
jgi:hypothetical protein